MKTIKMVGLVCGLILLAQAGTQAQSFLNYTGGSYTQSFNSLPVSTNAPYWVKAANPSVINGQTFTFNGATVPVPWDFAAAMDSSGTVSPTGGGGLGLSATMAGWYATCMAANQYGCQANGATTGGIYCFSTNSSPGNLALGYVTAGSSGTCTYGLKIVNNTGGSIGQFTVAFTGEKWLQQTTIKTNDLFYYLGDPGTLPTNNFTSKYGFFAFSGGASNGVDGTQVANQTNVNVSVNLSSSWTNGGVLWLVFQSDSAAGKAQQTAIKNLTFLGCTAPGPFNVLQTNGTTVCSGTSVNFYVTPTGGITPYTYQWTKNGSTIGGATASNYTAVAGTDFVNLDQITVNVSSACGATYTPPVVVMNVNSIPAAPVASGPSSIGNTIFTANWNNSIGATGYYLDVSTSSTFSSFVSGYNSLDVSNVASYGVSGLTAGVTYYYQVRAYDTCGTSSDSATTSVTTIVGCIAATAATPVASPGATVCAGSTLTLTETPSNGTAPFNYQWLVGGSPISNGGTISGATSNVLSIVGVATSDTGSYSCIVTAQCGGVSSTSPTLSVTVNGQPTITLGSIPAVCSNSTSTTLSYSATTGSPNQYSITWNAAALSNGFTNVGLTSLPGTPITLTVPAAAPAGAYNGTLTVVNSSFGCASSGYPLTLTINATPVITTQPLTAMVPEGSNATFTVATTAFSPTYQWQVNKGSGYANVTGGDGSGGTSAAFTTVASTNTMNGYLYQVIVTDGGTGCQTISSVATLTVVAPFGAGDLLVYSADYAASNNTTFSIVQLNTNTPNQSAIQSISINGTSGSSALRGSGSACTAGLLASSDDGAYIAFTGENTNNAVGSINTTLLRGVGTFDYTGKFAMKTTYTGISGNPVRGATSRDDYNWYASDGGGVYTNNATSPSTTASIHGIKSFGGTVYVLQAATAASATVVSTLSNDGTTLIPLPGLTNDQFATDFYLVSSGANGSAYDILYVLDDTTTGTSTNGDIVKYSLVGGAWTEYLSGGNFGFYSQNTGGDGLCAKVVSNGIALYYVTGPGGTASNSVIGLVDSDGWNQDFNNSAATTLYTCPGTATLKGIALAPIQASPCIAAITNNPASQIAASSSTVNFSVAAIGSSLSYQWQKNGVNLSNGGSIAGATSSNLTVTGLALADSDSTWDCLVISGGGCTNASLNGTLVVNSGGTIQPLGPTNLVLEVVGDGLLPLSSDATVAKVLELTTSGSLVQKIVMQNFGSAPASAPFNFMDSGSGSSDGNLTRSADGRFIILSGYNAITGESHVTSSNDLRTVGVLQYNGATNTPYGLNIGSGVNFRGATSSDGTNYWTASQNSASSGLAYFNISLGATNLLSTNNCRTVKIFNNQLYVVSGSANPGSGIFAVGTGSPTNGTPTWTLVITNGTHSSSPYNFEFNPATNVCYLTDDGPSTNFNGTWNGGGIQKYTNSGSVWNLAYIITNGCTKGSGAYGLAVDWSGANPILYATTASSSSNRVIQIVDNAGSLSTATTIYAPPTANYYLRSVAFAPVGPTGTSCSTPTITLEPTPQTVTAPGPASFTVEATGTALTYQWQKNTANVSDGGSISGSSTTNLVLTGVGVADSGSSWQCVVTSSGACSNTSSAVSLTVYTPYQAWQIQYFGSTNAANAAMNVDADHTGVNNLFKFVAGLDPTNPSSVFILSVTNLISQPTQKVLLFKPVVAGRIYTPEFTTDLVHVAVAPLTTFSGPTTNGSQVTLTDTNAVNPKTFYKINIAVPTGP